MSNFDVYARVLHDDTLETAQQSLECNSLIIRNRLFSLPITDALNVWFFLTQKYPAAHLTLEPVLHDRTDLN